MASRRAQHGVTGRWMSGPVVRLPLSAVLGARAIVSRGDAARKCLFLSITTRLQRLYGVRISLSRVFPTPGALLIVLGLASSAYAVPRIYKPPVAARGDGEAGGLASRPRASQHLGSCASRGVLEIRRPPPFDG